jgi:hypothetical protein
MGDSTTARDQIHPVQSTQDVISALWDSISKSNSKEAIAARFVIMRIEAGKAGLLR